MFEPGPVGWTVVKGYGYGLGTNSGTMYDTIVDVESAHCVLSVLKSAGAWMLYWATPCCRTLAQVRNGQLACTDCGTPVPPPHDAAPALYLMLDRMPKAMVLEEIASWLSSDLLTNTLHAHDVVDWVYSFTLEYDQEFGDE